jgi:hypothetical protein
MSNLRSARRRTLTGTMAKRARMILVRRQTATTRGMTKRQVKGSVPSFSVLCALIDAGYQQVVWKAMVGREPIETLRSIYRRIRP